MCIAIANFKNKPLTDQQIKNCWDNNPDGGGLLYKERGRLKVFKELKDWKVLLAKYKKVIKKSNCLVHFRIGTSGGKNLENCHPFMVNDNLGFIHNGVISGWGTKLTGCSDTNAYNELVLKKLPTDFLDNEAIVELVAENIGASKFVFMDNEENFTIMNSSKGTFDEETGNWFSNDSYKRVNNYVWSGNTKVYKNTSTKKYPSNSSYYSGGYGSYNSSFKSLFARNCEDGTIELIEDGLGIEVETGRLVYQQYHESPDFEWYYDSNLGGYAEPKDVLEARLEEDSCTITAEEIEELDQKWLDAQLDSIASYEDRLCQLFDQVPAERFDQVKNWQDINNLGGIMVYYLDQDENKSVKMALNVAIRLLLQEFDCTEKTFGHTVKEYTEIVAGTED